MQELLHIVNTVRTNKGLPALAALQPEMRLREDLGFDSLDLAELTARIDERFHVDVFA
ncbi:MAG: acyl carrier protein [Opitutaceae bacterium]|nr:acyl carrier protein [Opitutaceae bacterium]